jgi:hypothetical protein
MKLKVFDLFILQSSSIRTPTTGIPPDVVDVTWMTGDVKLEWEIHIWLPTRSGGFS